MDVDWQADLDRWLAPFVAVLRHKTRARMCPASHEGACVKLLHFRRSWDFATVARLI